MVVEDRASHYCGDIVRWNVEAVTLRERGGHLRHFGWKPGGFLIDGVPVTLVRPATAATATQRVTASGSVAGDGRARVAQGSRIWVEGIHDAELIEHVWGDDLRELGLVVEPLHGADDLAAAVAEFAPTRDRRIGVLLDHLVPGSKETRIAQTGPRPERVDHRPPVRRRVGRHPAEGAGPRQPGPTSRRATCRGRRACAPRSACRSRASGRGCAIRSNTFADLRPELVGAVEQLIDFVGE